MSLLTFFHIYTPDKAIAIDIQRIRDIESDSAIVIDELKKAIADIECGKVDKLTHDLFSCKISDIQILKKLHRTDPGYAGAKRSLSIIESIIQSMNDSTMNPSKIKEILVVLEQTMEHVMVMELEQIKNSEEFLKDYLTLKNGVAISQNDIDAFVNNHSNFIKCKPNKKLCKDAIKSLTKRITPEAKNPGPTVKEKEIIQIQKKLETYFTSLEFRTLLEKFSVNPGEKIMVGIFGSLSTGFASRHSKNKGKPTDEGRISDVDVGIVIDDTFLSKFLHRMPNIKKNGIYYGPFYEKDLCEMGPFQNLYPCFRSSSFAGRNDRKIGFIIVNFEFFHNNLKTEKYIVLGQYST